MTLLNPAEFAAWAAERAISVETDPAHGLRFGSSRRHARFWLMPDHQGGIGYPRFLNQMLDDLGPWQTCVAWFPGGHWPGGPVEDADELARAAVRQALGIPDRQTGAVAFDRAERGQLLALTLPQMHYGWATPDDIHLIPNHGQGFLAISHHEVIHATFPRPGLLRAFVRRMAEAGYSLPTEPPDPTFQPQTWLKPPRPPDTDTDAGDPDQPTSR